MRTTKNIARKLWQYIRYFSREFGIMIFAFLALGLSLDYLSASPLLGDSLKYPLKTLADALITAVPVGSLAAFVIDKNLTLVANCNEIGLKGIFRNKRDEAAINVMHNMLTRARKDLNVETNYVNLRFASITAKQVLHPDGELRREFNKLLAAVHKYDAIDRCNVEILLLHPFSLNALARAESEEWKRLKEHKNITLPVRQGAVLDQAWECSLFKDASISFREVAQLQKQYN